MQAPSALATLLNLSAAAPATKGGALLAEQAGQGFQQFMLLLGDLGAHTGGEKGQSPLPGGGPASLVATQAPSGAMLLAQGLTLPVAQGVDVTQTVITAIDARALLAQLAAQPEGQSQQQGQQPQSQAEAVAKVTAQLQQIVTTDTPQTLGEMVEAVVEPEQKLQVAGLLTGLLNAVKKVVAPHEMQSANPEQKEVPEQPMASMAQLSALMFRPYDGAVAPTPARTAGAAEKSEEIDSSFDQQEVMASNDGGIAMRLAFEPLAFTALVPVSPTLPQVALEDASMHAERSMPISAIDAMIPALNASDISTQAQTQDQNQAALPEVTLPYVPGLMGGQEVDRVSQGATLPTDSNATTTTTANAAAIAIGEKTAQPLAAQADVTGSVVEAWQKATAPTESVAAPSAPVGASAVAREGAPELAQYGPSESAPQSAFQAMLPTAQASKTLELIETPGLTNHATVKEQVQVAITKATQEGMDSITIQLEPGDLGRVEVKMLAGGDGKAQISFLVDKAETFDSLSRDARFLERSLQEAGIKADAGSMQFNLRQQPQPQFQSQMNDGRSQQQHTPGEDESSAANDNGVAAISAAAASRNYLINVREGVDISA